MDATPFNELFSTRENMQTLDEIEEELVRFQEMLPTILATRFIPPHLYIQGYIDALKWVLRDGKERR